MSYWLIFDIDLQMILPLHEVAPDYICTQLNTQ